MTACLLAHLGTILVSLTVPATKLANAVQHYEPHIKATFGKTNFDNQTTVHPLGLTVLVTMIGLTFMVKRKWAWLPIFVMVCTVPTAQRIIIATIDFSFVRLLVMAGAVRVFLFSEYKGMRLSKVDRLLIAWSIIATLAYTALRGSVGAFIFRTGMAYDALGSYLLLRCWIRESGDIDRVARVAAVLAMIMAVFFVYEHYTRNNLFSMFGGVPERTIIRQGRLRCQGPFVHPILAGTFWVGLMPLVASLWWRRPAKRFVAMAASFSICVIALMTSSSTPVMGVLATGIGMVMWNLRHQLASIRWGVAGTLLVLHMIMQAPVWHLISRVGAVGGSTGYHRFLLIDNCIKRWPEWVLLGTKGTAHWGHFMFDVANQFVNEAVKGGIVTLTLFVMIIVYTFAAVGRTWRRFGRQRYQRMQVWAAGVGIFAHCMMFISSSISHSQQNMVIWFLLLAIPNSLEAWTPRKARKVPVPSAETSDLASAA